MGGARGAGPRERGQGGRVPPAASRGGAEAGRRGAAVPLAETGAWLGCAHSAWDAAAGQRGGGAGQAGVIASGRGTEPGGGRCGVQERRHRSRGSAGRGMSRSFAPVPRGTGLMGPRAVEGTP